MLYLPQVKVSKEDFLALSDLAGDMPIMDYMTKVIHEHIVAQTRARLDLHSQLPAVSSLMDTPAQNRMKERWYGELSAHPVS